MPNLRPSSFRLVGLSCWALVTLAACNTGTFTGRSDKAPTRAQTDANGVPVEPVTPGGPTTGSTGESTTPGTTPTTPGATPGTTPTTPGTQVGTNQDGTTTVPPADKPPISIADIIGGIIKTIQNVEVTQPDNNSIVFGGKKVFHIGDANFSAESECASEISSYRLRGTSYFFEFQVLEANTTVDIGVNKICGIDYNLTNTIHLQDASADLEQKALPKQIAAVQFNQRVLQPGKYMVVVESRQAGTENPSNPTDYDDFIVGEVRIKASQAIKPGRVGAK